MEELDLAFLEREGEEEVGSRSCCFVEIEETWGGRGIRVSA